MNVIEADPTGEPFDRNACSPRQLLRRDAIFRRVGTEADDPGDGVPLVTVAPAHNRTGPAVSAAATMNFMVFNMIEP